MDLAKRFEQYADDFDRTFEDDDWSRLRQYFTEDAVREEHVPPIIDFRHEGIDEIIDGWNEIVDNFDRAFEHRVFVRVRPPQREGNVVTLHWVGIYCVGHAPANIGEGFEVARFRGDRIEHLESKQVEGTVERSAQWFSKYGDLVPGILEWAPTSRTLRGGLVSESLFSG